MNIYCPACKESEYKDASFIRQDNRSLDKSKHSGSLNNIGKNGTKTSLEDNKAKLSNINGVKRTSALLELQKTHGNQYVQRLVSGIQSNLKISQPNDIYEQEADEVANKVMGMSETQKPAKTESSGSVPNNVNNVLKSGQPLDLNTRSNMEKHLRGDFNQVRIHTDSEAAESARAVNAKAHTVGQDIVFGENQYNPGTKAGNRLIAHELVHTMQQKSSGSIALQRAIWGEYENTHDLKSSRFAGNPTLEACSDGEHRMTIGESDMGAVTKIQQAMIDLGYSLPRFGADGKYGSETAGAVSQFKIDQGITPSDGVVGAKTMTSLDNIFAAAPPQPQNICPDARGIIFDYGNTPLYGETWSSGTILLSRFSPFRSCAPNFLFRVSFYIDAAAPCSPSRPTKGPLLGIEMTFVSKKGKILKFISKSDPNPQYMGQGRPLNTSFGKDFDFKIPQSEDTATLSVDLFMNDWNSKQKLFLSYKDTMECIVIPCV